MSHKNETHDHLEPSQVEQEIEATAEGELSDDDLDQVAGGFTFNLQQKQQGLQTASNMSKQLHDTTQSIIRNIGS